MDQKKKYKVQQNIYRLEMVTLENLLQSELFIKGLYLGITICHQMILKAHEQNEPLIINEEQFYILSGNQLLRQMLDTVCDG